MKTFKEILTESISDFYFSSKKPVKSFSNDVKGAIDTYHHTVDKKLHSAPSVYRVSSYSPSAWVVSNTSKKHSVMAYPRSGDSRPIPHDKAMKLHGMVNLNKPPPKTTPKIPT